jgi:hypothetical protein
VSEPATIDRLRAACHGLRVKRLILRVLFALWCVVWFPMLIIAMSEFTPVSALRQFVTLVDRIFYLGTWLGGLAWAALRAWRERKHTPLAWRLTAWWMLFFLIPPFGPICFLFFLRLVPPRAATPSVQASEI